MKKLAGLFITLTVSTLVFGEDIELYISSAVTSNNERPQVLIMLDNSGSMSTTDTVTAPYDATENYNAVGGNSKFSSEYLYYTKAGASSTLPIPDDPNEKRRFLASVNSCKSAKDILDINGFYTGRVREYVFKGNSGTWDEIPDQDGTTISVLDCEDDVASSDDTNVSAIPAGFPIDSQGSTSAPIYHTADANDSNVEWSGQLVTIYTANYLRWHHDPSPDTVSLSRMDQAINSISSVVLAAPSVDFGLQVFNYNNGNGSNDRNGGRIVFGIQELTPTNKTNLLNIIQNQLDPETWTPLCESLYEASLYFSGKAVDFGDDDRDRRGYTANVPPMDSSIAPGNVYKTPLKNCNSNVYVIVITDGEPTNDTAANSKITSLKSKDADGNVVSFSGSKVSNSYLAALAGWMQEQDINLSLDGIQHATTFTIGFSDGASSAETLLKKTAELGGGEYFYADNYTQLTSALTSIFEQLEPSNESLTSASVAANNFDRTETLDAVYYAMFEPQNAPRWQGNLKKYKVKNDKQYGQGNVPALNEDTGHFSESVTSYWSTANSQDGDKVAEGGVADMLRNATSRTLLSDIGVNGSLATFDYDQLKSTYSDDAGIAAVFGVPEAEVVEYIDWHRGIDVDDEDKDTSKTDMRYDVFADPLHSKPLVINYGTSIRIVIGTNAGVLHMFEDNTNNDTVTESWAFMPKEFFGNVKSLRDNYSGASKIYGIDGKITSYIKDENGDGIVNGTDKVYIFFGLRRGGSSYYAMDVTSPDSPSILWHIDSSSSGFGELGQSWSQPKVTYSAINVSGSTASPVVIFAGGYDTSKDDAGPAQADSVGRAVYMVDAKTGVLKWSLSPSGGTTSYSGEHSIASPIATLDSDGNGLTDRLYFGDTGGDLWRVDMPSANPNDTQDPWTVFKLAALGGATTDDDDRRFFSEPAVVRTFISETIETTITDVDGNTKTIATRQEKPYEAILLGTGDRSNPLGQDSQDIFFMIKDSYIRTQSFSPTTVPATPTALTISDLYDYTDNPFSQTLTTAQRDSLEIAVSKKSGWFIEFDKAQGEKSTSTATVINGVAYLTSYIPPSLSSNTLSCEIPGGQGWLYAIDLALGTHKYNWVDSENPDGITDGDKRKVYISEQFLGSPTLIVVPKDDGDPDTVDEPEGNIIVGRRIVPVGFNLQTIRTNLSIKEVQ